MLGGWPRPTLPLRLDPAGTLARELGRLDELRGAGLKAVEDLADAHVCAYVGLWVRPRGPAHTLVAGDEAGGAILVPRPVPEATGQRSSSGRRRNSTPEAVTAATRMARPRPAFQGLAPTGCQAAGRAGSRSPG